MLDVLFVAPVMQEASVQQVSFDSYLFIRFVCVVGVFFEIGSASILVLGATRTWAVKYCRWDVCKCDVCQLSMFFNWLFLVFGVRVSVFFTGVGVPGRLLVVLLRKAWPGFRKSQVLRVVAVPCETLHYRRAGASSVDGEGNSCYHAHPFLFWLLFATVVLAVEAGSCPVFFFSFRFLGGDVFCGDPVAGKRSQKRPRLRPTMCRNDDAGYRPSSTSARAAGACAPSVWTRPRETTRTFAASSATASSTPLALTGWTEEAFIYIFFPV